MKIDVVATAFERFNARDFAGTLDLFHPDAEHADPLVLGTFHRGRAAILRHWTQRFADGNAKAVVYDMHDVAGVIVAIVRYQAYLPGGVPVGSPMIAVHRFVFEKDLIVRVEATVMEPLSEDALAIFLESAQPPRDRCWGNLL